MGRVYSRKYYQEHREEICKRATEWRKSHIKEARKIAKNRIRELRKKVINGYGAKCECCGENIYEFLSIDHINGNGKKDRINKGGHVQLYRWLIKNDFPSGYRVLCFNCNLAKGFWGYCPHEKEKKLC